MQEGSPVLIFSRPKGPPRVTQYSILGNKCQNTLTAQVLEKGLWPFDFIMRVFLFLTYTSAWPCRFAAGKKFCWQAWFLFPTQGFDIENSICGFDVTGRDSEASMRDALVSSNHSSATAHLGINMHNFPNMFILMGPNTVLAHNSVIFMLECQVDYVINALKQMMVMLSWKYFAKQFQRKWFWACN